MKPLRIVTIASEIAPFAKTGGLADVTRSLSRSLKRLGHEVVAIMPYYGQIIDTKEHELELAFKDVEVWLNSVDRVLVNYWRGELLDGLPIYFIENKKYFSAKKKMYGSSHENARFLIFDVAALKLLSLLKFKAQIIHCHDWQTGLIPYYLKNDFRYSKTLKNAKTVYTIHNLVYQYGHNWWETPKDKKDFGTKRIPHLDDADLENINFAKLFQKTSPLL